MIRIISFGYGHNEPPAAELTYDLRALLRNPFHDEALKTLTGLDEAVYRHVMTTPGARRLACSAAVTAQALAEDTGEDVVMAWGCTGGRHRSVALARVAAELLTATGTRVAIEHRDVRKPLLPPGIHSRTRHDAPDGM